MRVFVCENCRTQVTVPKKKGRTHVGHIKHMYCYNCKKITPHVQIAE